MYKIIAWCSLIQIVTSSRILCIFPTPFYSHQSVFRPLWQELSSRGHDVTVITTNPIKTPNTPNLKQIDLSFTYKLVYEDHNMQYVINTESNLLTLMKHVFDIMNNMTSEQLKNKQIQELVKGDNHFDLVIVEAHVPAWFGFAKIFNCPMIVVTSMGPTNHFKRAMGAINNPILTPSVNLPFDNDLTLFQRVISVIFEVFDEFQTSYLLYPIQEKIIQQAFQDPTLNLYEIHKNNVSLMFVNTMIGFNKATMTIPSIIHLNGLHIKPQEPLPKTLQKFLDGANDGLIYFSLGSNVKSYLISLEKQQMLLQIFQQLPFRIIWKFEDAISVSLPSNVQMVKWAPQQDILRHANTKLFITQGGLQSVEEAIRFKVPILGLPFFGDQFYNVKRVKFLQLGTWLDFNTVTEDTLESAILETIGNKTILANLEEMADLLDSPTESLNRAIWWVEYVIRHRGALHLRSPLADIPFYQYYLFDVIAFLTLSFVTTLVIVLKMVKIFNKILFGRKYKIE